MAVEVSSEFAPVEAARLIDLSEGGMRIAGVDLPIGAPFEFAVAGRPLEFSGSARVVHDSGGLGVAFETCSMPRSELGAMVLSELLGQFTWREGYLTDWA